MSKTSTSQIAREALLEMAKDGVAPSPSNYKKYFEKVSGILEKEPAAEALKTVKLQIANSKNPNLAEWKDAIDIALIKRDWLKIEELLMKTLSAEDVSEPSGTSTGFGCKVKNCADKEALRNLIYVMESFTANLESFFPEQSPLKPQLEIIKDLLTEPSNKEKIFSARRTLTKLASPAQLYTQLSDARQFAKKLALEFVKQIESTGDVTDTALEEFQLRQKQIEDATTQEELLNISRQLVLTVSEARRNIQEKHANITQTIHQTKLMASRITELETQLQAVSEEAKQDYLTGLMNRRGMESELNDLFKDEWATVSIALLDIDNFKKLNDTLGHSAGDQALKHLANAINLTVKDKGIPARLGGEEFVVIFPNIDAEQAKLEMEKLQRLLTKDIFMANEEKRVVTFSAGVAQKQTGETPDQLLSRADEAMYEAKKTGKNKVVISN